MKDSENLHINKCNIIGTDFCAPAGVSEAAALIVAERKALAGQYICFSNVPTTVMAHDDEAYRHILNEAAFTFPDGAPIAKLIRKKGVSQAKRVAGPDCMAELFRLSQENRELTHFFYGSSEKTLSLLKEKLLERYPQIRIVGMYAPPFRELTEAEDLTVTEKINASGAQFIWVGLGAPKQEKWMAAHAGRFAGVMLGVGAGFDFHAGTVKRAPRSMQRLGLEWLYRLFMDPKRLFKRYLVTNTKFILYTKGMRQG